MRADSPKATFLFARSSEAKKVESCLEWLSYRVNQEFKPRVMELESFILDLVEFTANTPPTFAQVRRLLFETKFDFVQGNRCDYHCQTDKIACAIGNVRKFFYFMCEILYDYYDFQLIEGHHSPLGFEKGLSRAPSSLASNSIAGDFSETMSIRSSISVGSYLDQTLRRPHPSTKKTEQSQVQNSFAACSPSHSSTSHSYSAGYKPPASVNSFCGPAAPARPLGRGRGRGLPTTLPRKPNTEYSTKPTGK